ncbi:MAG TPA: N-acetylmuramic acid 6-phosphate etherase [Candidatus Acidoferrales bacterium]|nr:N-acetylmuramic acid 6-phosphate etherase [Candidatus Acidoferrales bacterium]
MKFARQRIAATEQRNPRSRNLDLKPTREILRIMNREDAHVSRAVRKEIPKIARAVDEIAARVRRGGRLFYVGAGTSGRLGVLDASEIRPTFGTPRSIVQGVIAGGSRALTSAVERAEDSAGQGAKDLCVKKIRSRDVVVGLTASGTTPYVLGALQFARRRGALTVAVTTNRRTPLSRIAHVTIAPVTGPEVIAGSTRMKSGTAQKMVLNMLSTAAMVRLGHVFDNWMVNVAQTNQKLKRRALRILQEATGADSLTAGHAMRQAGHDLRIALLMLKTGVNASQARRKLAAEHGNLRRAIERGGAAHRGASRN